MKREAIEDYLSDPRVPPTLREFAANGSVIRQEVALRLAHAKSSENPDLEWIRNAEELLSKPSETEQYIIDTLDAMNAEAT